VIFTTSLIGAVRRAWPQTELHVLVAPRGELFIKDHPDVQRLWVWDKAGKQKSAAKLFALARELKEQNFDVVLNAHPSFRSRILTALSGAKIRVGYDGFGSRLAFTHSIMNDLAVEPDHAKRRVALLKELVPHAECAPLKVGLSNDSVAYANSFIAQYDSEKQPLLGIIPGSARLTKMWNVSGFISIAKRWAKERSGMVMIIGGTGEADIIEEIYEACRGFAVPVIGEKLNNVAAILARCEAAIGNDTGVSFLAIAAGCPKVIVLYGSTQVNYAFPPPHKAIAAGVPCCLPRTGHGEARCHWSGKPWCMGQITEDRVWEELQVKF
jgi:ADP-heptose:LPS heptosyltransferase